MPLAGATSKFSGVWLPVVTPFKDGAIDHTSYERLVDHHVRAGVAGVKDSSGSLAEGGAAA